MSKDYRDLSRRGLIELNQDFDKDNENMLINYLHENEDEYENIRIIERVVDKCDKIKQSMSFAGIGLKKAMEKGIDIAFEKASTVVSSVVEKL